MGVTTVESTALATVGYDEGRELLWLEFCGRAIYHYFGVPAAVHQAPPEKDTRLVAQTNPNIPPRGPGEGDVVFGAGTPYITKDDFMR